MTLFQKENPLAVTLTFYEVLASALADLGSKNPEQGPLQVSITQCGLLNRNGTEKEQKKLNFFKRGVKPCTAE